MLASPVFQGLGAGQYLNLPAKRLDRIDPAGLEWRPRRGPLRLQEVTQMACRWKKSARIGDFENGNLHVRRIARGHPVRDRLKLVQRIFQTIEQYGRRSTCRLTLTDVGLHVRRHAPRAGSTDVQVQSASTQGA